MSYRGTYEGKSLKHYRTPGSRNGYTKYPDKYTPIGKKASLGDFIDIGAKMLEGGKKFIEETVVPKVEKSATVALGPGEIRKTIGGAVDSTVDRMLPHQKTTASLNDDFGTFIRNDIHDRIGSGINKTNKYIKRSANRALNDERFTKKMREALESDYRNPAKAVTNSLLDPKNTRTYANIAADAFIPTYKKSKAKLNDNFTTFMKNDIKDRVNDWKHNLKSDVSSKASARINKVLKDPRMKELIDTVKNNPNNIGNVIKKNKSKYADVALDAAIPTYKKSKAKLNDNFSTFMKNDIKDRINDAKKVGKKKVKKLLKKFFK